MLLDRDQSIDQANAFLQREQRLTIGACAFIASGGFAVQAVLARRVGLTADLREIAGRAGVLAVVRRSGRYLVVRFAPGAAAEMANEPAGLVLS